MVAMCFVVAGWPAVCPLPPPAPPARRHARRRSLSASSDPPQRARRRACRRARRHSPSDGAGGRAAPCRASPAHPGSDNWPVPPLAGRAPDAPPHAPRRAEGGARQPPPSPRSRASLSPAAPPPPPLPRLLAVFAHAPCCVPIVDCGAGVLPTSATTGENEGAERQWIGRGGAFALPGRGCGRGADDRTFLTECDE